MQHFEDKRAIDDPMLNQDSVFDKKSGEDFDSTDDFHKHDDTDASSTSDLGESNKKDQPEPDVSESGRYDGTINI